MALRQEAAVRTGPPTDRIGFCFRLHVPSPLPDIRLQDASPTPFSRIKYNCGWETEGETLVMRPLQIPTATSTRKPAALRPRLSRDRHHVLQVLASSEHLGLTEAVMMAYGSSASMLAGMLSDGFVTATVEKVRIGNRAVKVRRYRIAAAGRKAIEDAMWRR
jgi:hypothetical protein